MDKNPEDQNQTSSLKKKRVFFSARFKAILKVSSAVLGAGILFGIGTGTGYVASLVKNDPVRSYNSIYQKINSNSLTSFAYFKDKSLIGQLRTEEDRRPVKSSDVSPYLINAIIATEDKTFYTNNGVDFNGFFRAAYEQLTGASVKTGGSTLTQQLIKQTILSPEKTSARKAKEIFLAIRVNSMFTKQQILDAYINRMYLGKSESGTNLYGVQAAAIGIFGVSAKDLNLAQSAYIAGMLQSPAKYIPFTDKGLKAGMNREKMVLQRMLENGKITKKDYDDALKVDLSKQLKSAQVKVSDHYPYLSNEIERRTAEILVDQEIAKNPELKKEDRNAMVDDKMLEVMQGGYQIYTTIDKNVYDTMHQVAQSGSDIFDGNRTANGKVLPEQVGAVMIDNKTGAILGMLEGRGTEYSQINYATSPRQPGSTMKPIAVYGPAMEQGVVQPGTVIMDEPYSVGSYSPNNDDKSFHGPVTVRTAVQWSYNIPAVKTFMKTGINTSLSYVKKMGVTSLVEDGANSDYNPSSAIGGLTYGISIEQLTNAYGTFANQGNFIHDYMIERIEDSNHKAIYQHETQSTSVFSPQTAYLMTDMMRNVVQNGTARFARNYTSGRDVAGKTGTSQNKKDIVFVGVTPDISMGVWVGYDNTFNVGNGGAAQQVWGKIFSQVVGSQPNLISDRRFNMPNGLVQRTIDKTNGDLATPQTASTATDYFNNKYVPVKYSINQNNPQDNKGKGKTKPIPVSNTVKPTNSTPKNNKPSTNGNGGTPPSGGNQPGTTKPAA